MAATPPRATRIVAAVLPGLPQLLAGRWGVGGTCLGLWVGCWVVLLTRAGRVAAAVGGAWDERLALGTLLAALVGSWTWSWRDIRRPRASV